MNKFTAMALLAGMLAGSAASAQIRDIPVDCARCGRVLEIVKIDDPKSGTGGAVAGAVIGGLVGNQIGSGDGKKVATVAGAVGGAYAGKKMAEGNREFKITVRMRDGSIKVLRQELLHGIQVGYIVRVKDGKARPYRP